MSTEPIIPNKPITGGRIRKDIDLELKKRFGHRGGFRNGQRECIVAATANKDVFCLMPTGGGKSVVYQVRF
jgi:ATP-dependent DNA helicase RecQ